ncbi:MAG: hypothetical protein IPF46_06830 [Saprospiraceae bacterium]|nr:hypothetical protein [Candidatus Vicinibacter affinis]
MNREKADDLTYPLSFDDVKSYFTKLSSPTPLSIGLAILAYIFMLLSWYTMPRKSRSLGSITTAKYEIVL